jgi:serine/threonine-protein kinase
MTGALVGSPNHMAPEIIEGRETDARSDIFSLGTILYWLATGSLPFAAPNPTATLRRVIEGDCQDPRTLAPAVSDELAAVIARALAVDPASRFQSAAELRQALDAVLAEAGIQDPQRELAAFLADPSAYKAAFPARLAAALSARAEEALRLGATARALKLWNRVLAVDPGNQPVLRDLARIERRARLGRALRRAGVAAGAAGALAVGLFLVLRTSPGRPPTPQAAVEARAPAAQAAPAAEPAPEPRGRPEEAGAAAAGEPVHPAAAAPGTGAHLARTAPRRVAPVTVAIHVRPYAQRALLDGVEVAHGVQRVQVSFEPGRPHRLEILHPCCTTFVREFAADEVIPQPLELKVPLQPRPALLRVQADPEAQVFVDGKLVGTAGDSERAPIAVPVPAGGESPYEGDAEIRIETVGRPTYATTARIRAGADLTVVASGEEATP